MGVARTSMYYSRELVRRLRHYRARSRHGYTDHGSLEDAARTILHSRSTQNLESGGHFRGVWPRDLCFSAPGLAARGYDGVVLETGEWLLAQLSKTFYTDFHGQVNAAAPREGVDTFPSLVILLEACGGLRANATEIARLASLHREKFFDDSCSLVTGNGSSWWDSAADPREAYNTVMLLEAIHRLEEAALDTTYTGLSEKIREGLLSKLWTGTYLAERRDSSVLACDANVVPLYFGMFDEDQARHVVSALSTLETATGLRMRSRPFTIGEVHPFFWFHRDYHYHVWPWNSFMYAIGLSRYGFDERATREITRIERILETYGTFLEILTLEGKPYIKRGYASAGDFTVAAALWVQYHHRFSSR